MKCSVCHKESNPLYMCDRDEFDNQYCKACFVKCYQKHEEGCATVVMAGPAEEPPWICEGCHREYAEYVNGCPACSEKGLHFSVRQKRPAEELLGEDKIKYTGPRIPLKFKGPAEE